MALRKYILIIVLAGVIVGGGILGYQYFWAPGPEQETEVSERKEEEGAVSEIQEGKIVFDVLYATRIETLLDDELRWLDVFAVPKVIDYENAESLEGFATYVLSKFPFENIGEGSPQYSQLKEAVSSQEAKAAIDSLVSSMFEENKVDRYSECSPYLHFLKNGVASVALRCYSSGGAHPIFYLSARNYDLENNKGIELEDFMAVDLEELKSFIRERKEGARSCDETMLQDDITNFYFTEQGLVITLAGHRLNLDCLPDSEFSFSFDEIREIIKKDSIISRLMQ